MTIRYRDGAYQIIVHIGRDPMTGKERRVSRSVRMPERKRIPDEVLQAEAKLRLEVAGGSHRAPAVTVSELLDRWLGHVRADLSPTTLYAYERKIALYIKPNLGNVRLAKLTTARLDGLYRSLRATGGLDGGLSAQTIRHVHAILRRALAQAQRWGWVERNVAELAEPPTVRKQPSESATGAQLSELLQAQECQGTDLGDLIALAIGTGARRGELCGLRWVDVDLDHGQVTIRRAIIDVGHKLSVKEPKSGKARTIPIGPRLVERLKARHTRLAAVALECGIGLGSNTYVLSVSADGTQPMHPNLASHRFGRLARKLGVPIRFHDLRHAAVTDALAGGAAPNDVAAHAGHASTRMTLDVYGHAIPAGLRRVAEILDARLAGS